MRSIITWLVLMALSIAMGLAEVSTTMAGEDPSQPSRHAPALTETQLARIGKMFDAHAKEQVVNPIVLEKLGIANGAIKQMGLKDRKTHFVHSLTIAPDGVRIFSFNDLKSDCSYRVDANLKLVAAISMTDGISFEVSEAEKKLQVVIAFWSDLADRLDDSGNLIKSANPQTK